ncbi:TEF transcription factor, PAR bZIP family member a isoform X1 [Megalops cyprinoides]|uniref:TEF transcription factor, PAR bZIP family member a isoform X1 n=1 Tax=Megalops cyprinoides TaxID=118141 RepID=UPI00186440D4|nr:TEF transcription factor, PAR bZIP family member a isoform X1 [Megalops cyprinoides]
MPGESTVTVIVDSGPPSSFPVVLKKIMENPPPNILEEDNDGKDKDKLSETDDGDCGGGGSGGLGPSAALTPAIWDKTIPYDGETFHLEYMDLDEFLLENGIPASLEEELQKSLSKDGTQGATEQAMPAQEKPATLAPPIGSLMPIMALDQDEEAELVTITVSDSGSDDTAPKSAEDGTEQDRATPSPIDPDDIEVEINFQPDPTDLVLSSVPGGELFDPRKHRFTEEELKPQPMIKKAKKVFVPEDQKDEKYWQRRKKNNVAAKRSRDARRLKENQITVRAAFLERENVALRQEVAELRKDFGRCKNVLTRYEAKFGPLAPVQAEVEDL